MMDNRKSATYNENDSTIGRIDVRTIQTVPEPIAPPRPTPRSTIPLDSELPPTAGSTPSPSVLVIQPEAPIPSVPTELPTAVKPESSIPPRPPLPAVSVDAGSRYGIKQNRERYKSEPGKWSIQAGSAPIEGPITGELEYVPVLGVDGVVVRVGTKYLVSPQTLSNVRGVGNPHYDIKGNGSVMGVPIGSSIPIIEIDVDSLTQSGRERDDINRFAAVRDVEYINKTDELHPGISRGLVEQINYTLNPAAVRPKDTFSIWNLNLNADYSMKSLLTDTKQGLGSVDYGKLRQYLLGANALVNDLRRDFNTIKELYYKGTIPASVTTAIQYTEQASAIDDIKTASGRKFSITEPSILQEFRRSPAEIAQLTADILAKSKALEVPQPPAIPAPVTASVAPITTNATRDESIVKWQAYGFTPQEKESLKTPVSTAGRAYYVEVNGTQVNIEAVFYPGVLTKARIIEPLNPIMRDTEYQLAVSYYGVNPKKGNEIADGLYYKPLNDGRKAELLGLAAEIKSYESTTGEVY